MGAALKKQLNPFQAKKPLALILNARGFIIYRKTLKLITV